MPFYFGTQSFLSRLEHRIAKTKSRAFVDHFSSSINVAQSAKMNLNHIHSVFWIVPAQPLLAKLVQHPITQILPWCWGCWFFCYLFIWLKPSTSRPWSEIEAIVVSHHIQLQRVALCFLNIHKFVNRFLRVSLLV